MGSWAHEPLGPWALGPLGPWAHGSLGPRAHGPLAPWALGPMAKKQTKTMNIGLIRVVMASHGDILGENEAYRYQEAFARLPGPPGRQKETKMDQTRPKT